MQSALRIAIARLGSISALAEKSQVTRQSIHAWLNNDAIPSPESAQLIAQASGMQRGDFRPDLWRTNDND